MIGGGTAPTEEAMPGMRRRELVALLGGVASKSPAFTKTIGIEEFESVVMALGRRTSPRLTRPATPANIERAIEAFARASDGGLVAAADGGATNNRAAIIGAAARHRLPAVYPFRYWATDGGLAVYGVDLTYQYRRAASYVDRILRGTNPADLPVQVPDKFELIINLKTAKSIGIDIPHTLLALADEVIE
jgi:putative ABC transport system substrate-binding protein